MMILTSFSLLIPAFSLPDAPLLLIGTASARQDCLVSYYALFECMAASKPTS